MLELLNPSNLIYKLAPKKDPLNFKIYLSLCIFRTIQTAVIDSMIKTGMCRKPEVIVSNHMGDSLLGRARSREASHFLESDADVFLAVDDDIQFNPEDAIKLCIEANEKKDVVAATCVIKREEGPWIASKPLEDGPPIIFSEESDPVEIKWAGAGMVAIHRSVFEDMIRGVRNPNPQIIICKKIVEDGKEKYVPIGFSDEWILPPMSLLHPTDLRFYYFFDTMVWEHPKLGHMLLSEDWAFCERVRLAGHKIWLHPAVRTVHFGHYGYTLDDLLRPPRSHHPKITYEDKGDHVVIPRDEGIKVTPVLA